jgi:hypothetical protein
METVSIPSPIDQPATGFINAELMDVVTAQAGRHAAKVLAASSALPCLLIHSWWAWQL